MTCCIISKRKFRIENEAAVKLMLTQIIWKLYCSGYDEFLTNCEFGISLLCSEVILALKIYNRIRLNIVMPYEGQADYWVEEYRERFFNVHEKADNVEMLNTNYFYGCYDEADMHMICRSDSYIVL